MGNVVEKAQDSQETRATAAYSRFLTNKENYDPLLRHLRREYEVQVAGLDAWWRAAEDAIILHECEEVGPEFHNALSVNDYVAMQHKSDMRAGLITQLFVKMVLIKADELSFGTAMKFMHSLNREYEIAGPRLVMYITQWLHHYLKYPLSAVREQGKLKDEKK